MRIMFSINSRVVTIETSRVVESDAPTGAEPPAIFDVSRAETQIRPQWDHEGPVPVARLGFQPNGVMDAGMHNYEPSKTGDRP